MDKNSLIDEIYIENFKSYKGLNRIPISKINIIYGENSSGKSSLMQSLDFFSFIKLIGNEFFKKSNFDNRYDNVVNSQNPDNNMGIGFKMDFYQESLDYINFLIERYTVEKNTDERLGIYFKHSVFKLNEIKKELKRYKNDFEDSICFYECFKDRKKNSYSIIKIDNQDGKIIKKNKIIEIKEPEENSMQIDIEFDITENYFKMTDPYKYVSIRQDTFPGNFESASDEIMNNVIDNFEEKFAVSYFKRIFIDKTDYLISFLYDNAIFLYDFSEIIKTSETITAEMIELLFSCKTLSEIEELNKKHGFFLLNDYQYVFKFVIMNIMSKKILIFKKYVLSDYIYIEPIRDKIERVIDKSDEKEYRNLLRKDKTLRNEVNYFLKKLDMAYEIEYNNISDMIEESDEYNEETALLKELYRNKFLVNLKQNDIKIGFNDVGTGVGQIIPILVELINSSKEDKNEFRNFFILQPELHIHPKLQGDIAEIIINFALSDYGKESLLFIETHSENMAYRVQKLIRNGKLDNSLVKFLYIKKENMESKVIDLNIDKDGFFNIWPDGFLEGKMSELK